MSEDIITTDSGAKRSHTAPYYHIIPAPLLRRVGNALQEGSEKYSESVFDNNFKKGDARYFVDAFNHVIEHLYSWWTSINDPALAENMGIDMEEDHLGHALANMGFLAYAEEMGYFDGGLDKNSITARYDELQITNELTNPVADPEMVAALDLETSEPTQTEVLHQMADKAVSKAGPFSGWLKAGKKTLGL